MDPILRILNRIPLFSGLADDELVKVRTIAMDKFYDKGRTIFFEGNEGNGFYIVASGKVKIFKVSFEGKEQTCTSMVRVIHLEKSPYFPENGFRPAPKHC